MQEINAFSWNADIDLTKLVIHLIIGFIIGLILRWHFKKFGSVLSNRQELGNIIPIITLAIILIISIVKSSLALSLGLVGALSIVRFRTPIKEPEELAYLFLSIAAGLGLGAGQIKATIVSFVIIIIAITLIKINRKSQENGKNMYLSLQINKEDSKKILNQTNQIFDDLKIKANLRKFDIQNQISEIDYIIDIKSVESLTLLTTKLQEQFKDITISFFDQNNLPKL